MMNKTLKIIISVVLTVLFTYSIVMTVLLDNRIWLSMRHEGFVDKSGKPTYIYRVYEWDESMQAWDDSIRNSVNSLREWVNDYYYTYHRSNTSIETLAQFGSENDGLYNEDGFYKWMTIGTQKDETTVNDIDTPEEACEVAMAYFKEDVEAPLNVLLDPMRHIWIVWTSGYEYGLKTVFIGQYTSLVMGYWSQDIGTVIK